MPLDSMQAYDIKRGHARTLEGGGFQTILEDCYDSVAEEDAGFLVRHGAIQEMRVWVEGNRLHVEMAMDTQVDDATAADTIRAHNAFLERATGFNAKQRRKRL
ncbi:MAG: DUF5611 family protein [Candidatus Thermoplasmatota archaeon]|nr:DUF5611 family protein [Candidatus Thermoplasmatota archaeon]